MKNLLLFIALALFSTNSQSQGSSGTPSSSGGIVNNGLISSNNRYSSITPKGEISYEDALAEYKTIDGSPFLHGGELTVDLITHKDSIHKDVTILYDLYNHEIIVKQKKGEDLILNQAYYNGFTYNNKGTIETYKKVHPTDPKYYRILFQNKDFAFCKELRVKILEETRHIPGRDLNKKKFAVNKKHLIIQGKMANYTKIKNDGLIKFLPRKYRSQVADLKQKLGLKKLRKEADYITLMEAFPKEDFIDQTKE